MRRNPPWVGLLMALLAHLFFAFVWPRLWHFKTDDISLMYWNIAYAFGRWSAWLAPLLVLLAWTRVELDRRHDRLLPEEVRRGGLERLDWRDFERLVGEAYRRRGYRVEHVGRADGDGGIDLRLRRGDERFLVQCKHWHQGNVGVKPVRELYGVLCSERADQAILVTSGGFTDEARHFAERKPLSLVDRSGLLALLRER